MKFVCALVAVLTLALTGATAAQAQPARPVVLVSIDGFRADYIVRAPTLARLGAEGVRAEAMRPSFPALTYPSHYTLVTGLRPDRHGLVHNVVEDPRRPGVRFTLGDRTQVRDPFWWEQGEPVWVTAKTAGLRAVSLFWPGDEAPTHGVRPDRWLPFNQSVSAATRVEWFLEWIAADRPHYAGLYFDDVDTAGHNHGPDSEELHAAVGRVDAAVARLLAGLQMLYPDGYDIIVTADHGMARTDNRINLDQIAGSSARVITGGATAMLEPLPGQEAAARAALVRRHDHMTCWDKQNIPARLHYGVNPRVGAIVCLGDVGWYLTTSTARTPSIGQHGYDPDAPEMAALFVARGPSFRQGVTLPRMDNVDVYPVVMRLLGLPPRPHDGDESVADHLLRDQAATR